jgi:putative membrane-bound dehydrogenase-like protein
MSFSVRVCSLVFIAIALTSAAYAQRTPEEGLKAIKIDDNIDVALFASEPMITNPAAIDIDTHGRVWVAEIQWYRGGAKSPPADKIKVLEDTDGDGKSDKATVFADGLLAPMSVCVAGDKVYVATSPDLWVYDDKDGDLKADGPPQKLLTGFGGRNHDHGAHSLVLGPDHKWWMSHGDTGFDVKGTDGSHIKFQWGAMLRGELDGSKLEVIAQNFRNPYEICMSSFGQSFVSDNDNDGNFSVRVCWILEGGDYGWFGRPPARVPPGTPFGEHWHFRGHIPGFVPATLVTGFGSPCGMCFYEGDAFGEKYKNAPLHTDNGPREVRIYRYSPKGFGMTATSEVFMTSAGDNYFRPDDICAAPDGSLYVSDWYDGGVGGHAYNDPNRGRIYRLTPKGKKLARKEKPGPYTSTADAIEGLKSVNLATQYLAREKLLADGERSIAALTAVFEGDKEPNYQARALWVLDRIGGSGKKVILGALNSTSDEIRALAVRILARHGDQHAEPILKVANDASPLVQREVLLALRKIKGDRALDELTRFAKKYNGEDRYLLEAINIAAGPRKEELYERLAAAGDFALSRFQLLQLLNAKAAATALAEQLTKSGVEASTQKLLLAEAGSVSSPEAGRGLLKLLDDAKTSAEIKQIALDKLATNLAGNWKSLADDRQLTSVMKKLLAQREMQFPALTVIAERGLAALSEDVTALATNSRSAEPLRVKAIYAVAELNATEMAANLRTLIGDKSPAIRAAAIAALVQLQDMKTVRELLTSDRLSAEERTTTADRLLVNPAGALVLLKMIDDNKLPDELKTRAIARAANHPDSNVRTLFEKHLPADQRPQKLGQAIKPEEILKLTGSPRRGQQIFNNSTAAQCKTCHTTNGKGDLLGPDLSAIGKKYERAALLETILEPSKAISHEFVPFLIETEDGRVYVGHVVSKDDKEVVLKDAQSKTIRIPQDNIANMTEQRTSLMPELVLRDVTAQDAADLLAYMMTLQATQPEKK